MASPLPSPSSTTTSASTTTAIATLGGASVLAACWISSGAPANRPREASVACVRATSAWMSLAWRQEAPRGAMEGDGRMATRRRVGGANPTPSAELEPLDAAAARASLSAAWPETTSCGTAAPWGNFLGEGLPRWEVFFFFFLCRSRSKQQAVALLFSLSLFQELSRPHLHLVFYHTDVFPRILSIFHLSLFLQSLPQSKKTHKTNKIISKGSE